MRKKGVFVDASSEIDNVTIVGSFGVASLKAPLTLSDITEIIEQLKGAEIEGSPDPV